MANEQQYFNPIIQAMMGSAQLQQGAAEQEIQKTRNANDVQAKKEQLRVEEQRLKYEHEHQTGQLDISRSLAQIQADMARLYALKGIREESTSGTSKDTIASALPDSMKNINLGGVPTAADEAKRVQDLAQGQAQGQMNVTLPAQMQMMGQEQKNKLELQNNENQFKQKLQESENTFKGSEGEKERTNKLNIAGLDRSTQLFIAQAHNATQLQMSGMGNPDTVKAGVNAALTGRINNLDGSSPYERAILNGVQAVGGKPISTKELDVLRQSQQLMPLFNKLEDFAKRDLPSNKLGAFVQGHALGAAKAVGWSPDTQNEINMLSSQAINIGRALEGMTGGRVLASQMQLDLNAFASGGITKDQMLDRINNLKDYYVNKVDNMYLMGAPVEQRALLYKQQGIMPGFLSTAPKTNKAGHKLDIEESIKRGQPVYSD